MWNDTKLASPKGYNQEEGIYSAETYNLVMKATSIRVIFALALSKGWSSWQLHVIDVKSACLRGIP